MRRGSHRLGDEPVALTILSRTLEGGGAGNTTHDVGGPLGVDIRSQHQHSKRPIVRAVRTWLLGGYEDAVHFEPQLDLTGVPQERRA